MIDLVILAELMERLSYKVTGHDILVAHLSQIPHSNSFEKFHPVLSILAFLLKAPLVPRGTPVVNALFKQRAAIENLLRACIGLPPENNMLLECKIRDRRMFEQGKGSHHYAADEIFHAARTDE